MNRFRKAIVALTALIVLAGQVLSDGTLAGDEVGALVAAAVATFGVFGVDNTVGVARYSKFIAAAVGVAGIFAAAFADSHLAVDEIGQLIGAVLAAAGVAAVANANPPSNVRLAGGSVSDPTGGV